MKTIGIISLSSPCDKEKLQNSKAHLEKMGFNVVLSKNILDVNRYFAGTDEDKLEELYNFFQDPKIDMIFNTRGGYGTIRLVNKINYEIIKNNPKPFIGYSDISALLLMFYKKAGIITYHGPMACTDFSKYTPGGSESTENTTKSFSIVNLFEALKGKPLEFEGDIIYHKGSAKGIIWGGNLSTVSSLCGIDFIPDDDFIFFTEDVSEPAYKIDKMFQQLFNIEKFERNCKGIVLGDFLNVDSQELLESLFSTFTCPTVGGFKITHGDDKITIPIGKMAEIKEKKLLIA